MKQCAQGELEDGIKHIVIDLSECSGMDSTFMGTMAGIAMKLAKLPDGKLEIANPGEKNRSSLEDLGLDMDMIQIQVNREWLKKMNNVLDQM